MNDMKKLLELRKNLKKKMPKFRRQAFGIYHRIKEQWRKPRGRHSKLKHQMAGHSKKVKPGFRMPMIVRGLDRTGLIPIIIHSLSQIPLLRKEIHGAIIGGNVGDRKRLMIIAELKKHSIKILNLSEDHDRKIHEKLRLRKQLKEEKAKGKEKAKESKPAKKETKEKERKEMTPEEKEALEKKEKDRIITKEMK